MATLRETKRPLTEDEFLTLVAELARVKGWRIAHFRPARSARGWRTPVQFDGQGFPDLTMVRGERLVFAELKSQRGRIRPDQTAWRESLEATSAEYYLWKPDDWTEILEVLA